MKVQLGSIPGTSRTNEDWAGFRENVAVVLDGVSAPVGLPTGCIHDLPWYVKNLGMALLEIANKSAAPLSLCLAEAIGVTADLHRATCDVGHPGTPSSTVAVARVPGALGKPNHDPGQVEWLVLSDATIILDGTCTRTITDNSVSRYAQDFVAAALADRAAIQRMVEEQRKYRNVEGGYWLAAGDPKAAFRALEGTETEVKRLALMTDGAAALVETYRHATWVGLLDECQTRGTLEVLQTIRNIEQSDPECVRWPRFKPSDDATILYMVL